jgi:hypothetical protein
MKGRKIMQINRINTINLTQRQQSFKAIYTLEPISTKSYKRFGYLVLNSREYKNYLKAKIDLPEGKLRKIFYLSSKESVIGLSGEHSFQFEILHNENQPSYTKRSRSHSQADQEAFDSLLASEGKTVADVDSFEKISVPDDLIWK